MTQQNKTLDRDEFIEVMAVQFAAASRSSSIADWLVHARRCLSGFLSGEGIRFGAPGYDWSRAGAVAMAGEDISYWECSL